MVDHEEPGMKGPSDGVIIPLSDEPLLDLLDALVEQQGKVAAAEALGVNYRTMVSCYESRHVSRRMRRALEEYRDSADGGRGEPDGNSAGDISEKVVALEEQVRALEAENQALRETIETQAQQLAELERGVEGPEKGERQRDEADAVGDDDGVLQQWRPPRRDHGLPDAGVVTLEEQPDEEHAFGPATSLVAEWRGARTWGEVEGSRFDRAWASVRRWELEIALLGDYGLTLPPESEPLDSSRREDHLRWRREALAAALAKARRLRWLRRVFTLGLRWR